MSCHPAPWDIYIYTYLYISSISPTSFYPFFFSLFFPARRGKNNHDFSFQTSILQVKRPRLVPSRCLWFKVRLEPLFLVPPGKFVAANECFKKVAHVPAARALVLSPGEGFGESQRAASSESQPRYHCRIALLPAFLALSIPLRNKQDRLDQKKNKIKKEKKSYDQNGSLLRVFFLHRLLLLFLLLRDMLQRKRVTGLDTALGEGESRQTLRDAQPARHRRLRERSTAAGQDPAHPGSAQLKHQSHITGILPKTDALYLKRPAPHSLLGAESPAQAFFEQIRLKTAVL